MLLILMWGCSPGPQFPTSAFIFCPCAQAPSVSNPEKTRVTLRAHMGIPRLGGPKFLMVARNYLFNSVIIKRQLAVTHTCTQLFFGPHGMWFTWVLKGHQGYSWCDMVGSESASPPHPCSPWLLPYLEAILISFTGLQGQPAFANTCKICICTWILSCPSLTRTHIISTEAALFCFLVAQYSMPFPHCLMVMITEHLPSSTVTNCAPMNTCLSVHIILHTKEYIYLWDKVLEMELQSQWVCALYF